MMKAVAPLHTVLSLFKRWQGEGTEPHVALAKILKNAGFGPEHPEHERVRAATEALLDKEASTGASGSTKLPELVATVVDLLLGLAKSERGLILVIEDVEHIDAASLDALDKLIVASSTVSSKTERTPRLFVLLAVRSSNGIQDATMAGWVTTLERVSHIEVGALAPAAARRLAALTVTGGRLPDSILDYIVTHCEGAPLNITQVRMRTRCDGSPRRLKTEQAVLSTAPSCLVLS